MAGRVLDTVLRGGKAVLPDGAILEADIGIADGRIAAIAAPETLMGEAAVDVKGLVVMPGIVDAHIHLGHGADISRPRISRDAETESAAAAAGGVTTFLSYVISGKPFEPALIDEVCAVTAAGSRVDFGLHLVISTEEQLAGVPDYAKAYGIPSFKLFMYSRGGEGLRIGLPDIDDGFLFRLAEAVVRCQGILCPHCENIEVAWVLGRRLMATDPEGKGGLAAWNDSRPPFVEAEAVHRVATLARQAGAPVYMVHCTSEAALEAALAQRRLGTDLTIETCTHYLTHTIDWKGGDVGKVGPASPQSERHRGPVGGAKGGQDRCRRHRSRASARRGKSRRNLEGLARLSRPSNPSPCVAQRGISQTWRALGPDCPCAEPEPCPRHGLSIQGSHRRRPRR